MMKKILCSKTGDTLFTESENTYYDRFGNPAFIRDDSDIRDMEGGLAAHISYDGTVTKSDGSRLGTIDAYGRFVGPADGNPLLESE